MYQKKCTGIYWNVKFWSWWSTCVLLLFCSVRFRGTLISPVYFVFKFYLDIIDLFHLWYVFDFIFLLKNDVKWLLLWINNACWKHEVLSQNFLSFRSLYKTVISFVIKSSIMLDRGRRIFKLFFCKIRLYLYFKLSVKALFTIHRCIKGKPRFFLFSLLLIF